MGPVTYSHHMWLAYKVTNTDIFATEFVNLSEKKNLYAFGL